MKTRSICATAKNVRTARIRVPVDCSFMTALRVLIVDAPNGVTETLTRAGHDLEVERVDAGELTTALATGRWDLIARAEVLEAQRQATAALLASSNRYRRIVENTHQGVWMIDAAGVTTFVNERMAQILGSARSEIVGRHASEYLDGAGQAQLAKVEAEHKAGNATEEEVRFVRRDTGESVETLVTSSPLFDTAGVHEGGFAMFMDVTDRKRAEHSLRTSEARFRSLWESGIVLSAISDSNGVIVDVNESFARATGFTREELVAGHRRWPELARPTGASTTEHELIAKDGRRVPIMLATVVLENEQIALAIDLTEQKRIDRALDERRNIASLNADLNAALTHEPILSAMLQRCTDTLVRHLNVATAQVWTVSEDSTLAVQATTSNGAPLDASPELQRIVNERTPYSTVCDNVAFAGYPVTIGDDVVAVVTTFARAPLADSVLEGLRAVAAAIAIGIQRQRTETTKCSLEAQLRQAQKLEALGSLAGGIAHDFNNILSVILSYTDMIQSELEPGHPLRADIEEINTAGMRASHLTRQLLAFSRQQVLQPRVLNLEEVARDVKSLLRRLVSEDIDLVITDSTVANVRADPGQIEQVLMNLVVNARDAMPSGGTITIETANVTLDEAFVAKHPGTTAGPHVMLSVADTGTGMTPAVRARVFEPFFTTKGVGKGTGLGLSTVFGIVRQSGGTIWVESDVGVGTTFTAYFPTVADEVVAEHRARRATDVRGSETVLICEDEAPVRALTRAILTKQGYRVLEAQNGGEALLQCEQHPAIDLLLTDVVMPLMSGRQLAERLHPLHPKLKVLYMSGYTDDAIVRYGVSVDDIAFLQKPLTPSQLTRKVREVLDKR
jgi:PAS domain S-box-containing protein